MKFVSTRGGGEPIGFMEALFAGLAPDGGLYVPQAWPQLSSEQIAGYAGLTYARVAADILGRFTGEDIPADVLRQICDEAYRTFAHVDVAPLRSLGRDRHVLELFHGPTLAFKDVAMQVLARLYEFGLARDNRDLTIVCATSGDTGGAAVEAFAGRSRVRIVALYPSGRISEVQRRFMTTSSHDNVRAVAVRGDFDDCQALLKGLFVDVDFVDEIGLSLVNSINVARVLIQIVYYVTAAVSLGAPDSEVSFSVPTGNFGDAYAGWAAHAMGLPLGGIVVATNENDILARALNTGVYRRGTAVATQSPSMDIQVASNFERLVFDCTGRDSDAVRTAFSAFEVTGEFSLAPDVLARMRTVFDAVAVSESETERVMAAVFDSDALLIDPHTAVAMAGSERARTQTNRPMVVLSTAHAAKFPEAVAAATGRTPVLPASVVSRARLPERIDHLPADGSALKIYLRQFAGVAG